MNNSLSPRNAGDDAWKNWFKDGLRTFLRLGPIRIGALCLALILICMGAAGAARGSFAIFLLMLPVMLFVGLVSMIYCQQLADQAAEGERASLIHAGIHTWVQILSNPRWLIVNFIWQILAAIVLLAFLLAITALLSFLASSLAGPPSDELANEAPLTLAHSARVMLYFLVGLPTLLQPRSPMRFSYWISFKHGADLETEIRLETLAQALNRPSLTIASFSFFIAFLLTGSLPLPVGLFAFPMFLFLHAAIVRCAYHDIFEDGTGLKEKESVKDMAPGASPILQA